MNEMDINFINQVESVDFRTNTDTGANENALYIWNKVRRHVGLPPLHKSDLPAFCTTHKIYHTIRNGYGCVRA